MDKFNFVKLSLQFGNQTTDALPKKEIIFKYFKNFFKNQIDELVNLIKIFETNEENHIHKFILLDLNLKKIKEFSFELSILNAEEIKICKELKILESNTIKITIFENILKKSINKNNENFKNINSNKFILYTKDDIFKKLLLSNTNNLEKSKIKYSLSKEKELENKLNNTNKKIYETLENLLEIQYELNLEKLNLQHKVFNLKKKTNIIKEHKIYLDKKFKIMIDKFKKNLKDIELTPNLKDDTLIKLKYFKSCMHTFNSDIKFIQEIEEKINTLFFFEAYDFL